MPQLMTSIWLNVLFFAWVIFLLVVIPMIMKFKFLNTVSPAQNQTEIPPVTPWTWTWN